MGDNCSGAGSSKHKQSVAIYHYPPLPPVTCLFNPLTTSNARSWDPAHFGLLLPSSSFLSNHSRKPIRISSCFPDIKSPEQAICRACGLAEEGEGARIVHTRTFGLSFALYTGERLPSLCQYRHATRDPRCFLRVHQHVHIGLQHAQRTVMGSGDVKLNPTPDTFCCNVRKITGPRQHTPPSLELCSAYYRILCQVWYGRVAKRREKDQCVELSGNPQMRQRSVPDV